MKIVWSTEEYCIPKCEGALILLLSKEEVERMEVGGEIYHDGIVVKMPLQVYYRREQCTD